jgi:hypothetical protein
MCHLTSDAWLLFVEWCGASISELMFTCEVWCWCLFRHTLEKIGQLDPYVSAVDLDEDALEAEVCTAYHLYSGTAVVDTIAVKLADTMVSNAATLECVHKTCPCAADQLGRTSPAARSGAGGSGSNGGGQPQPQPEPQRQQGAQGGAGAGEVA